MISVLGGASEKEFPSAYSQEDYLNERISVCLTEI